MSVDQNHSRGMKEREQDQLAIDPKLEVKEQAKREQAKSAVTSKECFQRRVKLWVIAAFLLLALILFNQIAMVSHYLSFGSIWLERVLFLLFAAAFIALLGLPFVPLLRHKALADFDDDLSTTYSAQESAQAYSKTLRLLRKNRYLKAQGVFQIEGEDDDAYLKRAQTLLQKESRRIIRQEASRVFMSTAISQNGALDGLFVCFRLLRLVLRLAKLYENAPSLARLAKIYTQIAGTIFLAKTLEDTELLASQLEPVLSTLIGSSILSGIPLAQGLSQLVLQSLMNGSVNALLTLRVGLSCDGYLSNYLPKTRGQIAKYASSQACQLLWDVLKDNSSALIQTFFQAAKNTGYKLIPKPSWFGAKGRKE